MPRYIILEKKVGETPLQVITAYKEKYPKLRDVPMAYAGRLDPMASGKLLILLGDECKNQRKYHGLDKKYDFEILFDFTTDSGDVLGIAERGMSPPLLPSKKALTEITKSLRGEFSLPYPAFSSKTVGGKQLFLWALEDRLHEIEMPVWTSHIYSLQCTGTRAVSGGEVLDTILQKINSLPAVMEASKELGADFRRADIRARWHTLLDSRRRELFGVASFSCVCASGLYIRSLAPHIAELLNRKGLAYSIHRSRIGRYRPLLGFRRSL